MIQEVKKSTIHTTTKSHRANSKLVWYGLSIHTATRAGNGHTDTWKKWNGETKAETKKAAIEEIGL